MNVIRAGSLCLVLAASGLATDECRAAARYSLTDLGTDGANDMQPGSGQYSAPQVDASGAIHSGRV